jgi:DNA-binding LacI/PurR family transcriptional regulator
MTYTIRDVARLASVSIATVSAVLTGKKPVSADLATLPVTVR